MHRLPRNYSLQTFNRERGVGGGGGGGGGGGEKNRKWPVYFGK